MLIKLIYEDEKLDEIKEKINQLETKQLYFLQEYIRKEKRRRKEKVFEEWKETLENTIAENNSTNNN